MMQVLECFPYLLHLCGKIAVVPFDMLAAAWRFEGCLFA
jgi:hypothetical protein